MLGLVTADVAAPLDPDLLPLHTALRARLGDIIFARVDIASHRSVDGGDSYVVTELELIEPSFYFTTAPATVELFADRLTSWLRRNLTGQLVGGT